MSYRPDQLLLGPLTVMDNQSSPATLFSYNASSMLYATIEYSMLKGGSYRTGTITVSTDGSTITSIGDEFIETASSGVVFSASFSGGSVNILYTSIFTGGTGIFRYTILSWS